MISDDDTKKKADLWREILDDAGEDEIEAAANVSVAQAEKELAAAGFDVAAERAKAEAFLVALERGGGEAAAPTSRAAKPGAPVLEVPTSAAFAVAKSPLPHVTPADRRRPIAFWLAAAATVTVAGGALYAALSQPPAPPPPPPSPLPAPSTSPSVRPVAADLVAASTLRRQVAAACDTRQWSRCLSLLDQARTADPAGDETPAMKTLRDQAIRGIEAKPKPPP